MKLISTFLIAEHKFPFSLVAQSKLQPTEVVIERVGGITDKMDKDIGRPVIKIAGTVSANNYIEFDNLCLVGRFMYLQIKLLKSKVATIHLEVFTSSDVSIRITLSTLYCDESPRFLGRSLR